MPADAGTAAPPGVKAARAHCARGACGRPVGSHTNPSGPASAVARTGLRGRQGRIGPGIARIPIGRRCAGPSPNATSTVCASVDAQVPLSRHDPKEVSPHAERRPAPAGMTRSHRRRTTGSELPENLIRG
jgi:hypothetical protein